MAAVTDWIVINFPEVPTTLKLPVIVVVVAAVKAKVRAFVASEKLILLKVFEPVIVSPPTEPDTVNVSVPYVNPAPANVLVTLDVVPRIMVESAADIDTFDPLTLQKLELP